MGLITMVIPSSNLSKFAPTRAAGAAASQDSASEAAAPLLSLPPNQGQQGEKKTRKDTGKARARGDGAEMDLGQSISNDLNYD